VLRYSYVTGTNYPSYWGGGGEGVCKSQIASSQKIEISFTSRLDLDPKLICWALTLDLDAGSGFGSRNAKINDTCKKEEKINLFFEKLDILFGGLEGGCFSWKPFRNVLLYFIKINFSFCTFFFVMKSLGLASALDQDSSKKFVTANNENIDLKHCFSSSFKVKLEREKLRENLRS
jgi:hypothetical protein